MTTRPALLEDDRDVVSIEDVVRFSLSMMSPKVAVLVKAVGVIEASKAADVVNIESSEIGATVLEVAAAASSVVTSAGRAEVPSFAVSYG